MDTKAKGQQKQKPFVALVHFRKILSKVCKFSTYSNIDVYSYCK